MNPEHRLCRIKELRQVMDHMLERPVSRGALPVWGENLVQTAAGAEYVKARNRVPGTH